MTGTESRNGHTADPGATKIFHVYGSGDFDESGGTTIANHRETDISMTPQPFRNLNRDSGCPR